MLAIAVDLPKIPPAANLVYCVSAKAPALAADKLLVVGFSLYSQLFKKHSKRIRGMRWRGEAGGQLARSQT